MSATLFLQVSPGSIGEHTTIRSDNTQQPDVRACQRHEFEVEAKTARPIQMIWRFHIRVRWFVFPLELFVIPPPETCTERVLEEVRGQSDEKQKGRAQKGPRYGRPLSGVRLKEPYQCEPDECELSDYVARLSGVEDILVGDRGSLHRARGPGPSPERRDLETPPRFLDEPLFFDPPRREPLFEERFAPLLFAAERLATMVPSNSK
jgi:hypothetical protein